MDIEKKTNKFSSLKKIGNPSRQRIWIGTYIILALICLSAYFLLRIEAFNVFGTYQKILQKIALGGFITFIILLITTFFEKVITQKSHNVSAGYNLVRLLRLMSVILIFGVIISLLFVNWYAAAVSLGLISLILGFALQTPISSFIGWIYILVRAPYHVGDRIQIDTFKGDVVEVNYLDTTLWEFGGEYLTNDLPSGRLIRFPNSLVLQSAVYNYSWKKFPYIWNEIPIHVAYESDLDYVEKTVKEISKNELGDATAENIRRYKELLEQTAVDELEIKEYPYISLRINTNTWVEVVITYLVEPKQAAAVRTRLIRKMIEALLKEPGKVMFPKSNAR